MFFCMPYLCLSNWTVLFGVGADPGTSLGGIYVSTVTLKMSRFDGWWQLEWSFHWSIFKWSVSLASFPLSFLSRYATSGRDYIPNKVHATQLPVAALCLFLAIPLIYAGLNATTVPKVDSMDTLQDRHTRRPTAAATATSDANTTER